jgi:hypothetical protein
LTTPTGSSTTFPLHPPFQLWPTEKLSRCHPLFGQIILTEANGLANPFVKKKLKELGHFQFRLVEDKVHPILKMRY